MFQIYLIEYFVDSNFFHHRISKCSVIVSSLRDEVEEQVNPHDSPNISNKCASECLGFWLFCAIS